MKKVFGIIYFNLCCLVDYLIFRPWSIPIVFFALGLLFALGLSVSFILMWML